MAFIGLHIFCSQAGADGGEVQVLRAPVWSETFAAPGTTAKVTPPPTNWPRAPGGGEAVVTARAAGGGWWISIGAAPADPTQATTTRIYVGDGDVVSVAADRDCRVRVAPAT